MDLREMVLHFVVIVSAILAMVSRFYFTSSYSTVVWIYMHGVAGALFITVPDWAFFYRSPFSWNQPLGNEPPHRSPALSRVKRAHSFKLAERVEPPHISPFRLSSFQCVPTSSMLISATSTGARR